MDEAPPQKTPKSVYERIDCPQLRQGEILSNVFEFIPDLVPIPKSPEVVVKSTTAEHPLAIVVSQDCDLEQDFLAWKELSALGAVDESDTKKNELKERLESRLIPNVLLCVVQSASETRSRSDIKSDMWRRIAGNNDERYQVLEALSSDIDEEDEGLPSLAIDFKQFFCVRTREIYFRIESGETRRRAKLSTPYAEQACIRSFRYTSRVALPREHEV